MNNKTILHLGSGKCSELDSYLATEADKIVLVEANKDLVEQLHCKVAETNRVEILDFAVSDRNLGLLNEFNLIHASSLHKPTALLELYPGLKSIRHSRVKVRKINDIVKELKIDNNERNLLVIDIPGEEYNCLENLANNNLLYFFSRIHLNCGIISLYENSKKSSVILDFLKDLGYEIINQNTSADPDRPCWNLQLNSLKLENLELKKLLKLNQNEQNEVKDEIQSQIEQLNEQSKKKQVVLTKTQKEMQLLKIQSNSLKEELVGIKKSKLRIEEELNQTKQNGALTVKLLRIKEADLKDLQERYSNALTVQENQHKLLVKLSEQLNLASNYFHQISDDQLIETEQEEMNSQLNTYKTNTVNKKKLPKRGQ